MSYLCIHGHFYQPPREHPWLETSKREPSAAPFYNWNERILHECYRPNTAARLHNADGLITGLINTYSRISFNFGPTLLQWIKRYHPRTLEGIQEADRASIERFGGHGNAMAQVYNHVIMPLATRRDKQTQVRWGIDAFKDVFGRHPEGMWLSETAVDTETLEVLAAEGICFVILSPRQAKACLAPDGEEWHGVDEHSLDTKRAYRCQLPEGRSITIFFYDGGLAHEVAFGGVLNEGPKFWEAIETRIRDAGTPLSQLFHLATDGESYGHHTQNGESALSYVLDTVDRTEGIELINYGLFLERQPPSWEVQIHERTSWSCFHGIDRWSRDCPCHGGHEHWQHHWRQGLREGLEQLKARIDEIFEEHAARFFEEPWAVRDEACCLYRTTEPETVRAFLDARLRKELSRDAVTDEQALRLLDMQRQSMLMFTSCGWFFDDISGLETVLILGYACRAIHLASFFSDADLESPFVAILSMAPSNLPSWQNGAEVWKRAVKPQQVSLRQLMGNAVVLEGLGVPSNLPSSRTYEGEQAAPALSVECSGTRRFYQFLLRSLERWSECKEECRMTVGCLQVQSLTTLSEQKLCFVVLHFGHADFHVWCQELEDKSAYKDFKERVQKIFYTYPPGHIHKQLQLLFRVAPVGIEDLLPRESEWVVQHLLGDWVASYNQVLIEKARTEQDRWAPLMALDWPGPTSLKHAISLHHMNLLFDAIEKIDENSASLQMKVALALKKREFLQEKHRRRVGVRIEEVLLEILRKPDLSPASRWASLCRLLELGTACGLFEPSWEVQTSVFQFFADHPPVPSELRPVLAQVCDFLAIDIGSLPNTSVRSE